MSIRILGGVEEVDPRDSFLLILSMTDDLIFEYAKSKKGGNVDR
jgi:hypothetical protein